MKKLMVLLAACSGLCLVAGAQCNENIKWSSSRSDFLDTAGNFQHSTEEVVQLTANSKKITVVRGTSGEQLMNGDVTNYACNWKNKQNGKTSFNAVLVEPGGKTRHATITIEATNGKTTILLEAQEEDTKIRLNVDSSVVIK